MFWRRLNVFWTLYGRLFNVFWTLFRRQNNVMDGVLTLKKHCLTYRDHLCVYQNIVDFFLPWSIKIVGSCTQIWNDSTWDLNVSLFSYGSHCSKFGVQTTNSNLKNLTIKNSDRFIFLFKFLFRRKQKKMKSENYN